MATIRWCPIFSFYGTFTNPCLSGFTTSKSVSAVAAPFSLQPWPKRRPAAPRCHFRSRRAVAEPPLRRGSAKPESWPCRGNTLDIYALYVCVYVYSIYNICICTYLKKKTKYLCPSVMNIYGYSHFKFQISFLWCSTRSWWYFRSF